jgi:hypothetical protein
MKKTNTIFLTTATALMLLTSATSQAALETYTQDFSYSGYAYHLVFTADNAKGPQVLTSLDSSSTVNGSNNIAIGISGAGMWDQFYNGSDNMFDPSKVDTNSRGWSTAGLALFSETVGSGYYRNLRVYAPNGNMFGDGYGHSAGRSAVTDFSSSSVTVARPAPVEPVSEPAIIALFALGLVGIGFARRRQS